MSDEMIVKYCSPTLAGIKTGSLFSCPYADRAELKKSVCRFNRIMLAKGLRALPLRFGKKQALIYVYRPSRLASDLKCAGACLLLSARGYAPDAPARCIAELTKRLSVSKEFPHEIGLFLGYPPEDVRGFIENGSHGSKITGCWKVYGDEAKAEKLFARYKKCTEAYRRLFAGGKPIERLAVAV